MKTKLLNLTKNLIKRKSITPIDDGAILILKQKLGKLGFTNIELPFQSKNQARVLNLFSIVKNNKNSIGFYVLLDTQTLFPQEDRRLEV